MLELSHIHKIFSTDDSEYGEILGGISNAMANYQGTHHSQKTQLYYPLIQIYYGFLVIPNFLTVPVLWRFTLHPTTLTVRLYFSQSTALTSELFREKIIKNREYLYYIITLLNQSKVANPKGRFEFDKDYETLAYQISEHRCKIPSNFANYIKYTIQQTKNEYTYTLSLLCHYFEIPKSVENDAVEQSSLFKRFQVTNCFDTLQDLKYLFYQNRFTRYSIKNKQVRTTINLQNVKNKIISNLVNIPKHLRFEKIQRYTDFGKIRFYYQTKTADLFNVDPTATRIVTPITVKQSPENYQAKYIARGGFGVIKLASQTLLKHSIVSEYDTNKIVPEYLYVTTNLVIKSSSDEKRCGANVFSGYPPLKNYWCFLSLIGDKKCESIASYYLYIENQEDQEVPDDPRIFVEYYRAGLKDDLKRSTRGKLTVLLKIIKGLCYLSEWKILHRDIKPSNILLNYDDLPKIIDFGSCAPFADIDTLLPRQKEQEYACLKKFELDNKYYTSRSPRWQRKACSSLVYSTPGYYLPFSSCDYRAHSYESWQKKMKGHGIQLPPYTPVHYERNRYSDMYSLGRIIVYYFGLYEKMLDTTIRKYLFYLSQKCCEANPADRLDPKYAYVFVSALIDYYDRRYTALKFEITKERDVPPGKLD